MLEMFKRKECGDCKHFAQGKTCSYCENPKQTDEDLKGYCYYNFSCKLFERGECKQRTKWYNNLSKEEKKVFEDMKDWPNQQWYKDLLKQHTLNL